MTKIIINGDQGCPVLVFAHGAGAAMDSDFMNSIAIGLADQGVRVVRFEFLYMQLQRESGKRRPPDRQPKLLAHFEDVINQLDAPQLFVGGKSMGGRMATMLASRLAVKGSVVFGYPFHALGKPEKVRIDHFDSLSSPVLICQGKRDAMGSLLEVAQYRLPPQVTIEWFDDGDHDLKPRKSSGYTHQEHLQKAITKAVQFINTNVA